MPWKPRAFSRPQEARRDQSVPRETSCPKSAASSLAQLPLCCRPRNGRFYKKRGVSGPSALLGPEMVKFCWKLCSCAVDLEMAVFNWKRAVSGPAICPLSDEMGQIWPEFLPLCCRPRNGLFYEKRGVSGPSVLLGLEMVKFCRNLCYCAVDLYEKRGVSGPSALLGPEMVKFCRNFCSCAVDLEMAVFVWKRAVSGPYAL